jgi:hypothetical protein
MKLAVSHNKAGEITLMFDPSKLQGAEYSVGYEPAPGEDHHHLEVPKGYEGKPVTELAHLLRVNTHGGAPKLEAKG